MGMYNGNYYFGLYKDTNSLKHWKYTRKEQLSNGKFRYYYEDDDGKEEYVEGIKGITSDFDLDNQRSQKALTKQLKKCA